MQSSEVRRKTVADPEVAEEHMERYDPVFMDAESPWYFFKVTGEGLEHQ